MAVDIDTNVASAIVNASSSPDQENLVPKWLSKSFIEMHLQRYYNEPIKVISFDVKSATAPGENYASQLYRLNVTFEDHSQTSGNNVDEYRLTMLSMVIKSAVTGEVAFEAMSENNVYHKEIEFYNNIAPKILQALTHLNEPRRLIAKPYGVCNLNSAILFEDLTLSAYRISSVYRGFNFDEAKLVLEKAATFHAINAVLQEQHPNIFDQFPYGLMSRHTKTLDLFYESMLRVMTEVVTTWPEADYYVPKLRQLRANLMEKGAKAFAPDPDQFNTLIQGDMWVNNIMVKRSVESDDGDKKAELEQPIENVMLIDFQYACWSSPVIDLHYFLNTSLQESLRPNRFDELIDFYHGNLVETLKRLRYKKPIPTLEQLKQQYLDKSFYGFVVSCIVQPLMINENTEDACIEGLLMEDERAMKYKRMIYSSPKVQANLRKLIPIYDKMGHFD